MSLCYTSVILLKVMNVRYILITNTVSRKIHRIFPVADLFFLLTTCDNLKVVTKPNINGKPGGRRALSCLWAPKTELRHCQKVLRPHNLSHL